MHSPGVKQKCIDLGMCKYVCRNRIILVLVRRCGMTRGGGIRCCIRRWAGWKVSPMLHVRECELAFSVSWR